MLRTFLLSLLLLFIANSATAGECSSLEANIQRAIEYIDGDKTAEKVLEFSYFVEKRLDECLYSGELHNKPKLDQTVRNSKQVLRDLINVTEEYRREMVGVMGNSYSELSSGNFGASIGKFLTGTLKEEQYLSQIKRNLTKTARAIDYLLILFRKNY